MRIIALLTAIFYLSTCFSQRIDIPLFTIKLGKSQNPEVHIGPFSLDKPIAGILIESEWVRADIDVPYLKVNKINYANRAACAVMSKKPARSFSVVIDTMNAAKAAYRLAQATGRDPKVFTKMAVKRFRYSVMELLKLISTRLVEGNLPLLPHDNDGKLEEYSRVMNSCPLDQYCHPLDDYIGQLWNGNKYEWNQIDTFSKRNVIDRKKITKSDFEFGCYRQLKFSPLANNYLQTKPTKESLEEVALAHIDQRNFLEKCDEFYQVGSMESSSFQGELLNLNESEWNTIGFDFWHSLKLYFSWAWRNATQMEEMIYPFGYVFKSVHLEDSVMLIPNGCYSITEPRCDSSFLNEQQMRDFAKKSYESEITTFDHLKFLPEGVSKKLLEKRTPIKNDFLELGKFSSMEEWGENFRKNFTRSRGVIKGRLQSSVTDLSLISSNLAADVIIQDVKGILMDIKPYQNSIIGSHKYDDFYYLCSEFTMVSFDGLSYKNDLLNLKEQNIIDPLIENLSDGEIEQFYDYYIEIASGINRICQSLESDEYWKGEKEINRSGYRDWMKELIFPDGYPADEREREGLFEGKPLLAYGDFSFFKESERVICFNGIDCARNILESMVKLYSVAQYIETYFVPFQNVNSSALNNPYAERTACKVYDPWWKLKKGIFNLFADTTLGLIGEFNPTPFYIDLDLKERKVVSFNELWEDGTLKLDPLLDKKRLLYWAGLEFGPLLGASCSVAISNTHTAISPTKHFLAGITLGACTGNSENNITIYSGPDEREKQQLSGCFSCTLNFQNIASGVGQLAKIPYVGASFYLIRGFVRFFEGVFDPVDTPRSWEVDINNVLETYRRYGEIPKKCVGPLKRGQYCLEDQYEYAASKIIQRDYGRSIKKIIRQGNRLSVESYGCRYPIFNISTNKLLDAVKKGNYVEQIEDVSYCEWSR